MKNILIRICVYIWYIITGMFANIFCMTFINPVIC